MSILAKIPFAKAWEIVKRVGQWVVKASKFVFDTYKKAKPLIDEAIKAHDALRKGKAVMEKSLQPRKADEELSMREKQEKFQLQQDTLGIVIWSKTINRFSNNIQLHTAQLNIHFEALKSHTAFADVILQHHKTLQELVTAINVPDDIADKKSKPAVLEVPSFNIENQYRAFLVAQGFLKKECSQFISTLDQEINRANRVATMAEHLLSKQDPLYKWVKGGVIPSLSKVKAKTEAMHQSIAAIPMLPIR